MTEQLEPAPPADLLTDEPEHRATEQEPVIDSEDMGALLARNAEGIARQQREAEALRASMSAEEYAAFEARYAASAPVDAEVERRALREATLSASEQSELLRRLAEQGVAAEEVSLIGRAVIHHDVAYSADDWLSPPAEDAVVDKAQLLTSTSTVVRQGIILAPHQFGRINNGQLEFRRPETNRPYHIVVPDAAPGWLFDAITQAANDIGGVTGDCVGTFWVLRNDDYNDMDALARALGSKITVGYGNDACDGQADGCATYPRIESLTLTPNSSQTRMRFGNYLGFETDYDSGDAGTAPDLTQANARSIALHELSHIFGFDHASYTDFGTTSIGGTSVTRVPSTGQKVAPTMMTPVSDAYSLFASAPSSEDIHALRLLYGGQCSYTSNWRAIGATCQSADEQKCLRHGASCEIDSGGAPVCRWPNLTDQAACNKYSPGTWRTSTVPIHPSRTGACIATTASLVAPNSCSSASTWTGFEPTAYCCSQVDGAPGMFFFANGGIFSHYICSDLRDVYYRPDWDANWEFSSSADLGDFTQLGGGVGTWVHDSSGAVRQDANVYDSILLGNERVPHGCVQTRVVGPDNDESGLVFGYLSQNDYYRFVVEPNVHRRVEHVVNGAVAWTRQAAAPLPNNWLDGVELRVCFANGIHTFVNGARVSYTGDALFDLGSNSFRRSGLWNNRNAGAVFRYLRSFPLVQGL